MFSVIRVSGRAEESLPCLDRFRAAVNNLTLDENNHLESRTDRVTIDVSRSDSWADHVASLRSVLERIEKVMEDNLDCLTYTFDVAVYSVEIGHRFLESVILELDLLRAVVQLGVRIEVSVYGSMEGTE